MNSQSYISEMPADAGLASATFERLTADEQASALDAAVKVINRRARTPQKAEDLHIFPAVLSTDALDSHFSRMHESSLKNYATDAGKGVPFMNSHRTNSYGGAELPLGHTYEGAYDAEATGPKKARAGIYMLRGHAPNGTASVSTDDMMRGIDAGTTRDGSVGFYGGKSICDVCGNDVRDYRKCPHIPGTARETENGRIATYTVHNARLREFSGVYAGSTPGAMFSRAALDKTERAVAEHLIGAEAISYLEEHYRFFLTTDRAHISVPGKNADDRTGKDLPAPTGRITTERTSDMKAKELLDAVIVRSGAHLPKEVREALEGTRASLSDEQTDCGPVLEPLARALEIGHGHAEVFARLLAGGVTDITPDALVRGVKDGQEYRKSLIEDAIREGVRAQGDHFAKDTYQAILSDPKRSVAEIKSLLDGWKAQGDARLSALDDDGRPTGAGGRQTVPLHGFEHGQEGGQAPRRLGTASNYKTKR